jgi:hypothetical protein
MQPASFIPDGRLTPTKDVFVLVQDSSRAVFQMLKTIFKRLMPAYSKNFCELS